MKLNSMFLRSGCALPEGMDLPQEEFCAKWMSVVAMAASVLDSKVRKAGWHFVWLVDPHSSFGIGRTVEAATSSATVGALKKVDGRFNGAELCSIKVRKYLGFQLAEVMLQPRQIQPGFLSGWLTK
jgi:hypothetical protein